MGDMADMALDDVLMALEHGESWARDDGPLLIACKYCNKGGFHWFRTSSGWRLADEDGKIHSCKYK